MAFLRKKYFSWQEPKAFVLAADELERRARRWWHRPLGIVVACALTAPLLHLSIVAKAQKAGATPPPIFEVSLGVAAMGVFMLYFIPWLAKKSPSQIVVFDKQLGRSRGNFQTGVTYSRLQSFAWDVGPEYATLTLTPRKGRPMVIGVPPEITRETLTAFLLERNVRPAPAA